MATMKCALLLILTLIKASAFSLIQRKSLSVSKLFSVEAEDGIISPFDSSSPAYTPTDPVELDDGPLELTWDNVELVLEEMRPYLISDGGNVAISEIDGPVVRLELQVSIHNFMIILTSDNFFINIYPTLCLGCMRHMSFFHANHENGVRKKT